MEQSSAHAVAHQILAREIAAVGASSAVDTAHAAERAFQGVSGNLTRWVGPDATHALFARALVLAQRQSPALHAVPPPTRSALLLDAVAAHGGPHDNTAVIDATGMILTTLIELLGRLIGDDLAVRLVAEDRSSRDGVRPPRPADAERDS